MHRTYNSLKFAVIFLTLAFFSGSIRADDHPSVKHAFNLAPPAELTYGVTASYGGLKLKGDSKVKWSVSGNRFDISVDTNAMMLGKILASRSEGVIDGFGVAPTLLTEKRMRKPQHTVTFARDSKVMSFSDSDLTYPIKGGEQDRTSITWQMVSIARGAPAKVVPGTEWPFLVAGRRDAEAWTFKVVGRETVRTPLGDFSAIRITKLPSSSREQQHLELWLAPSLEWYPVRMLFTESNGLEVDQVLQSVVRR